eukprot:c22812_g1_i1 orf=146-1927(-)
MCFKLGIMESGGNGNSVCGGSQPQLEPLLDGHKNPIGTDLMTDWRRKPAYGRKFGNWRASSIILGCQGLVSVGFAGVNNNLVIYLTKVMHKGNATAANDVTNLNGTMLLTSMIGAFIGDAYLGRLWASVLFTALLFIGFILISLSALIVPVSQSTSGLVALFYIALYTIALGNGCYQPNLCSLGADQFDEPLQKSHFFSFWLVASNVSMIISATVLTLIENMGMWALAFWLSTGVACLGMLLLFSGAPIYRQSIPVGNPLPRIAQVLVASIRKWQVEVPTNGDLLYDETEGSNRKLLHSENLRWFDKAATVTNDDIVKGVIRNPWRLCTITQVEEVKCICRIFPIWVCGIFFSTAAISQKTTLFVEQGVTMDNVIFGKFKIPSASMIIFNILSIPVFVLILDRIIMPWSRRLTKKPEGLTTLQRVGMGQVTCIVAMVIAALVERRRLIEAMKQSNVITSATGEQQLVVPMSIFWLVPQYVLTGCSQAFVMVGHMDFFYDEMPPAMRSMGNSLALCCTALGNYLSTVLVIIVTSITTADGGPGWIPKNLNMGHVDNFYWLLAAFMVLTQIFFMLFASWYRYLRVAEEEHCVILE